MTKFDPEQIDFENLPAWVELEYKYRDIEDEAYQDDSAYPDWLDDDDEYRGWVESFQTDPDRPTFTNGWRFYDHGAMPTIKPYPVNNRPFAQ